MKIKYIALIFMMLCILLIACSCSKNITNLDDFEQLLLTESDTQPEAEPFAEIVYVVISENCSGKLALRAEEMARKIKAQTAVEAVVKYDYQQISRESNVLEIIVGNTDRLISQEIFKSFRELDYICRFERGSILLGGKSESATIEAIDKFESDILVGASNATLMSKNAHFEFFGEYSVKSLTLNGFYIYDYAIVYDDAEYVRDMALVLRDYIFKRSGHLLDLRKYRANDISAAKMIFLKNEGVTENGPMLRRVENGVEICAGDEYGMSFALASFATSLLPDGSVGECESIIEDISFDKCAAESVAITLSCAEHRDTAQTDFLVGLSQKIKSVQTDILAFFNVSGELIDDIDFGCGDGYQLVLKNEGDIPTVCPSDRSDGLKQEYSDGISKIEFLNSDGEIWNVYRVEADGFYRVQNLINGRSLFILEDRAEDVRGLAYIDELEYGFDGEERKYYIYAPKGLEVSVESERKSYQENTAYASFNNIIVKTRFHEDFLSLQNTLN